MGEYTGTVPTFLAGEWVDASKLLELTNLATALTAAWGTWTPTWSGFAGNPALGNGTMNAKYRRIGKTIDGVIALTMGSTTTFGSGQWRFSLPGGATVRTGHEYTCAVWMFDASASNRYVGAGRIAGTLLELHNAALGATQGSVTSAAPFTWATSDLLSVSFTVEVN